MLATGSSDHNIILWNPEDGSLLTTLKGHSGRVLALAFSSENILASASDDKTIMLWDPEIGEDSFKTLKGHTAPVNCLSFAHGLLASGSSDKTIRIWNQDGIIQSILEEVDSVTAVAFSHNSSQTLLASACDKTVNLWKLDETSIKSFQKLNADESHVLSVAFSDNPNTFASGGMDKHIMLWQSIEPTHVENALENQPRSAQIVFDQQQPESITTATTNLPTNTSTSTSTYTTTKDFEIMIDKFIIPRCNENYWY